MYGKKSELAYQIRALTLEFQYERIQTVRIKMCGAESSSTFTRGLTYERESKVDAGGKFTSRKIDDTTVRWGAILKKLEEGSL